MNEYRSDRHSILHCDVLAGLRTIADNSVDLVFADPPYNIGKDFDGILDSKTETAYLEWCQLWIDECKRILRPHGTFYLMCSTQMLAPLDLYCRKYFSILSRIVWSYDSSGVQAKQYFGSMWEPVLHMVADKKKYVFNSDAILVEAKTGAVRRLINYRKDPPEPYNVSKVPGNVWEFPRVRFKMDEYESHPSQKPEALLERIILASSNADDVILDPFAGTFTTCAVGAKLNRRTIGIEINDAYVKIGLRRVGVPSHFKEADLRKIKERRTKNKSKRQRQIPSEGENDQAKLL